MVSQQVGPSYWAFDNQNHDYATVHRATCIFCKDGRGLHERRTASAARSWLGPYASAEEAFVVADSTGRAVAAGCKVCAP